jgi:hypothetical protein
MFRSGECSASPGLSAPCSTSLRDGLVLRHPLELPVAQAVAPAVAYLHEVGPGPHRRDHGERGGAAARFARPFGLRHEDLVAALHRFLQLGEELGLLVGVQAVVEVHQVGDVLRDVAQRGAARHVAVRPPADAVGHHEQEAARLRHERHRRVIGQARLVDAGQLVQAGDQEMVVVLASHLTLVREAEAVDVRRDGTRASGGSAVAQPALPGPARRNRKRR